MRENAPRSALIVRLSSIGDVIHTLPAYTALRDAWPSTRLGWAVEPAAAPLLRRIPDGPTVHVLDTRAWRRGFWRSQPLKSMQSTFNELRAARYELALDFQGLIKSAIFARLSGAPVWGLAHTDLREPLAAKLYAVSAPPSDHETHIIERSLHLAASAGVPVSTPRFPPVFNRQDKSFIDAELDQLGIEQFIVMHGVANWQSKRWPLEQQSTVGRDLYRQTGMTVLWVWGPGEEREAHRSAATAGEGNLAAFQSTLPQLSALLHRARLFVGGDSAPLHLAVANKTPTVGIFGPTSPHRLGPIDPADRTVISLQPCSYCHQRRCPLGTRACLETLTASNVVAAAHERLSTSVAQAG